MLKSPPLKNIFKENKEKSYRNDFPGPQNCSCSVAHKKVDDTGCPSKFGVHCTVGKKDFLFENSSKCRI